MDDIIFLISTVGFPITACFGMGWYIVRRDKENSQSWEKMNETLEANTILLTELKTVMKGWQ